MRLFEIESLLVQEMRSFPFMKKNFVYLSSTLNFENKSGIKVSQTYKMPDGLTTEEVYKYYSSILAALDSREIKRAEYIHRTKILYDSILSLNPDLMKIVNSSKVENAEAHVITAALSRFNIDDITSYVSEGKTGRWYIQAGKDTRYNIKHEIETLTGAPINWIMSDKTLNRVYSEVKKRFKNEIK